MGTVDCKHTTSDLVRCPGRNSTVAINRTSFQSAYIKAATFVTRAAHEDATPANGSAVATSGKANQIGGNNDTVVRLHVPKRECTVQHVDPVAVRAFVLSASVGCNDVEAVNIDVPATYFVPSENLNTTNRR